MMRIELSKQTSRILSSLMKEPSRELANRFNALRTEPHPEGSERLKGSATFRKLNVGIYRIIYSVGEEKVSIVLVDELKRNRYATAKLSASLIQS